MNLVRVSTPAGQSGVLGFERGFSVFAYHEQAEDVSLLTHGFFTRLFTGLLSGHMKKEEIDGLAHSDRYCCKYF